MLSRIGKSLDRNPFLVVATSTTAMSTPLFCWWLWRRFRKRSKESSLESERHGGELVAEVLKHYGVRFIFTLVGGHISPILVACKASGLRVIDVRHEATAVFAADAVSRLNRSDTIGVAVVTAGPGVTNTITALKNCQMAQSAMLLIGGAAATMLRGRGNLQDIDQLEILRPICKFVARCKRVKDIIPMLQEAMFEAQSGIPGPVFVEIPIDLLYPISEIRANCGLITRIKKRDFDSPTDLPLLWVPSGHNKLVFLAQKGEDQPIFLQRPQPGLRFWLRILLRWRVNHIFANGFSATGLQRNSGLDHHQVTPPKQLCPPPRPLDLERVAKCLTKAQKPLILLGSQSVLHNAEQLAVALKKLGVPAFLGGGARGLLGTNCPYHARHNRRQALQSADLIILAGVTADFRLNYGRSLPKRSRMIAVNRSLDDLRLNCDIFWRKPALSLVADPSDFVRALAELVQGLAWENWRSELCQTDKERDDAISAKAKLDALGNDDEKSLLVNPIDLLLQVDEVIANDAVIIGDGGDFVATAANILRPRGPLSWLDPGPFGTLGVGAGFALGAALSRPEAEIWLILGDGSTGYSLAEFDTFRRFDIPVIALVGNDAAWSQIAREQLPIFNDDVACRLAYTRYDEAVRALGGEGIEIRDGAQAMKNLKMAKALAECGIPVLLNAHIGTTDFRDSAISV